MNRTCLISFLAHGPVDRIPTQRISEGSRAIATSRSVRDTPEFWRSHQRRQVINWHPADALEQSEPSSRSCKTQRCPPIHPARCNLAYMSVPARRVSEERHPPLSDQHFFANFGEVGEHGSWPTFGIDQSRVRRHVRMLVRPTVPHHRVHDLF